VENILHSESGAISMTDDSCRFSVENSVNWKNYLEEHGFVVIKNVLSTAAELANQESLLWDCLEAGTGNCWERNDPASWKDADQIEKITHASLSHGIVNARGVEQSEACWEARKIVHASGIFSEALGRRRSCTSIDGVGLMRPWFHGIGEKTEGGWFHVDQGIGLKGKMKFVQGMLSLYAQNEDTGSFTVVAGSHKFNREFCKRISQKTSIGPELSVVRLAYLDSEDEFVQKIEKLPKKMVKTEAGDFVLWDSRTFHCSTPSLIQSQEEVQTRLSELPPSDRMLRAVFYIWMKPKACWDKGELQCRRGAFERCYRS